MSSDHTADIQDDAVQLSKAAQSDTENNAFSFRPDMTLHFHFPGRITNWTNWDRWNHYPSGYIEFPLSVDITQSFTVTCWYKAQSRDGWHTLISIESPSYPHPLLYISISPSGDFQFEVAVGRTPSRVSSDSSTQVMLNVWSHLAYVQDVSEDGSDGSRTLYINGTRVVSTSSDPPMHNPDPLETRMAIMRGAWNHQRTAGFIGQAENIAVFQRAFNSHEIPSFASKSNAPADHGWPINGQTTNLY